MKRILDWKLFNESVSSELDEDIKWSLIDLIDYGFEISQIDQHKYEQNGADVEELLIGLHLTESVVWSGINSIDLEFDIDGSFKVDILNAFYDGSSLPTAEDNEIENVLSRESSKMENELIELMKNSVGKLMETCGYDGGKFKIGETLLPVFGAHNSDGTRRVSFNINISFRKNIHKNMKHLENFSYITDNFDNYINESVMSDIKSYVKKGVLTATLLTSLLGNSAYGQTQKDEITKSLKSEIVQPGPMEEFLNKYVGDDYFIAKGSSKYDLEAANTEARLEGQSKGFTSIVDQKAFKKDGKIIYIIIYKNKK